MLNSETHKACVEVKRKKLTVHLLTRTMNIPLKLNCSTYFHILESYQLVVTDDFGTHLGYNFFFGMIGQHSNNKKKLVLLK